MHDGVGTYPGGALAGCPVVLSLAVVGVEMRRLRRTGLELGGGRAHPVGGLVLGPGPLESGDGGDGGVERGVVRPLLMSVPETEQHIRQFGVPYPVPAPSYPEPSLLARRPWPRSAWPCRTQFRSPSALTSSPRTTSVTLLPDERTRATASRLHSSEYRLLQLLLLPTWHYFLWNLTPPVSRCPASWGSFTPAWWGRLSLSGLSASGGLFALCVWCGVGGVGGLGGGGCCGWVVVGGEVLGGVFGDGVVRAGGGGCAGVCRRGVGWCRPWG